MANFFHFIFSIVANPLALVAALIHFFIFYLETFKWTDAKTRKIFGTNEEEAKQSKEVAYNLGWYNLFLAIMAALGVLLKLMHLNAQGNTLLFAGLGSMIAASVVLVMRDPSKAKAAVYQGGPALIALVANLISIIFQQ